MSKRVLITGGTGFVGRPAVEELDRRRFEVHVTARRGGATDHGATCHVVDLLDADAMRSLLHETRPTHLLHLAWSTEHGRFWEDPANAAWAAATLTMAETFREVGGERFVLAGSCGQYEWSEDALGADGVAHERSTPMHPTTTYGRAKQDTMQRLEELGRRVGFQTATGLIFFPFGPREQERRLVPSVTRALVRGERAPTTAGTQVRDFVFVDDCGGALAALVDSDVTGPVNVASGTGTSIADVARAIGRLLDREDLLDVGALAEREGEPRSLVADVARLRDEVRFAPRFPLEEGLRVTVEWWADQRTRRR